MFDICCIGHITSDKIVTHQTIRYLPGGTAYYFSCAVQQLHINCLLVTAIAPAEMHYVNELRDKGMEIKVNTSTYTTYFENIYGENPDDRTQNVLHKADAFNIGDLVNVEAKIFHLGPLLTDDISAGIIKTLAGRGQVSLDVQGYLRRVVNGKVYASQWIDKNDLLPYIFILKADVAELGALTGYDNIVDGVKYLADQGVKEIVITNGSKGSTIYADGVFYNIPAYPPKKIIDATGCGDTYMAGYLYRRIKNDNIHKAGEFAAAMAALKMENSGPFTGTEEDIQRFLQD